MGIPTSSPTSLDRTLVDRCRGLADERGSARAFTWLVDGEREGQRLTFAGLDAHARALAARLLGRGLSGERALLVGSPGLEFVVGFMGCLYAGVVPVPLSAARQRRVATSLSGIVQDADPAILLAERGWLNSEARHAAPFAALESLSLEALAHAEPAAERRTLSVHASDPDAVAFLQYTSGSTGRPRGVEVTHRNLMHNEAMIRAAFGHGPGTTVVGWLPLFHDMGLVGNVLQPLFLGAHSVLMSPGHFVQRPVRWLRALTRYGGTTSGGPNFGYELCLRRVLDEELAGLDLSRWRVAFNGAEPVRAATLEAFAERFAPVGFRREAFYPCYGMAEATLLISGGDAPSAPRTLDVEERTLRLGDARPVAGPGDRTGDGREPGATRRLVSCGRTWLGGKLLIVDPRRAEVLGDGRVGEIWVRGEHVARGYRNLTSATLDPFRSHLVSGEGPYLATGDLGFVWEGELYVTGRRKDVILQNGRNFYPQDIEWVAGTSHAALRVDHAAAFTVEEGAFERLVVVQEVRRDASRVLARGGAEARRLGSELVESVRQAVSAHFGLGLHAVTLIPQARLPMTSSGKVQRRRCRSLWQAGELEELRPARAPQSPSDPVPGLFR